MDREHKERSSSSRSRKLPSKSNNKPENPALLATQNKTNLLSVLSNAQQAEYSREDWENLLRSNSNHSNYQDNESVYFSALDSDYQDNESVYFSALDSDYQDNESAYFSALDSSTEHMASPYAESEHQNSSDYESEVPNAPDPYHNQLPGFSKPGKAPEADITVEEVTALIENFKQGTHDKQGKIRKKGRGKIFKTVDNLLEQFYQCSSENTRNDIIDNIVSLCNGWKKKHKYTIIQNKSYKKINDHLINFESSILKLKNRHLDIQINADRDNIKLEKTQKSAEKLIAKYKHYEGTPEGFFHGVLPSILDLTSPDTGDKTKFDTLLRFPVHPGVFVGIRASLGIERKEDNELKVNFEGNVQSGATVHGVAAIGGEFGVWCECIAKDTKSVGKLLDYGLFRRFRESKFVPREITNKLWGGEFKADGYKKSEEKAAQIEKDIFGEQKDGKFTDPSKKSQVEWGSNGGLISDYKVYGLGSGKAGVQGVEAQRYSQYTIDQTQGTGDSGKIEPGTGVGKIDLSKLEGRGAQKTKGQGIHRVFLSNSGYFGGGIGKYGIKLKLDFCSKPGSKFKENHINKWELELDGGANIPASAFANNPLLALLPISLSVLEALRSMGAQAEGKYKTKSQKTGAFFGPTKDLAAQLTTAFSGPHTAYKVPELLGKNTSKFEGFVGLNVNFKLGKEAKPDQQVKDEKANLDPLKADLAIYKTGSTAVKFLDNEIRLETAKRIMQWKWQRGNKAKLELYPLAWNSNFDDKKPKGEKWSELKIDEPKGPLIPMVKESLRRGKRNTSSDE
jgi:hypothetical protein